jgi:hypothetical protein
VASQSITIPGPCNTSQLLHKFISTNYSTMSDISAATSNYMFRNSSELM